MSHTLMRCNIYLWGRVGAHCAPLHMRDPQYAQDIYKWEEDRVVIYSFPKELGS
jgi:hypothetical protein